MNHNLLQRRALRAALVVLLAFTAGWTQTHAQNGVFSVSDSTQVIFSPGNLQYRASTNTWRFALNQWDYVGEDNANISETYDGWIDLFGWGTSGYNHGAVCYQPWSTSTSNGDYYAYGSSTYNLYDPNGKADWGYNAINNGGNQENLGWRTPTKEEWSYLFNTRSTASGIRYAKAVVNDVNGVILLPDDWSADFYTLNNTNTSDASFSSNIINETLWVTLEEHGVVFLPAAGHRNRNSVYSVGSEGGCWSSSCSNSSGAEIVYFYNSYLTVSEGSNYYRSNALSVRLVRASQGYSFGINATLCPEEGGSVSGAGSYEEGAECTLTATASGGYDFACWTENGMVVSTTATYSFLVVSDRNVVANFVTAGDITFADANVKALCVANWDANGDGELSYAEAAGVTSLGSLFKNNTTITSFNELQFFIGLGGVSANAFNGCSSLSSIGIPSSVSAVGENAFKGCTALASAYYAGDVAGWCGIQFNNEYSNPLAFANLLYINNELVRNLVIPNTVTSIGNYAFYNYKTLLSIQLPNGLTSIGDYSFYYCNGINGSLTLPNSLNDIGNYAFYHCDGIIGYLTLPGSLESIGRYAFANCSGFIGDLVFPESLAIIGEFAFYYCNGFTGNLVLPEALTTIERGTFSECSGFSGALVIPNSVVSINGHINGTSGGNHEGAFNRCSGFTSLIIPNSVSFIGTYTFWGCGVSSITIGTGLNQIDNDAFLCGKLKEVIFNASNCRGENVFKGVSPLQKITLGEDVQTLPNGFTASSDVQVIKSLAVIPPVITNNVFPNVSPDVALYVPCEAKADYQSDPIWGNFTNYQDSAYELLVEPEDDAQGSVSIEKQGTCDDPTSTVKANPKLHYGFSAWLKNGEVVSTDRIYTFDLEENTTLVARFEPSEVITNHWTARNFKNYKPVKGIITIDDVEQFRETLEVGAFCGDECRASVCAMWFPPTEQYVVNLTIGTDQDNGGELITFRLYDHELNEEPNVVSTNSLVLDDFDPIGTINNWFPFSFSHEVSVTTTVNPAGAGEVTGAGDYLPGTEVTLTATANEGYVFREWTVGGQTVSAENPYTFTVTEAVNVKACFDRQQSQALVAGWNWWSTYIEMNGVDGLTMLENSLGHDGSLIMSQGVNVENYYSQVGYDYWWGNLSNIQNEKCYKLMVSAPCTAVMTGTTANPANHPIAIQPSWNWIGYPCAVSQYIANANFQPSDGDVVVTQGSNATYYNGYGWWPDFVMEPSRGYQYYSTDSNTKNMVFSNVRGEVPVTPAKDDDLHWTARNFKNYKAVKGIIYIDDVEQFTDRYEIGAFCGDECRASVRAMLFPITNQYVVNLTIGTDLDNGNELITFKIYDHQTEQELDLESTSTLTLDNFDPMGTINNWFPFTFVSHAQNYMLDIAGYGTETGRWYLIATPLADDTDPEDVENLINPAGYDLYRFNQSVELEWENYKHESFALEKGRGYLYANSESVTLTFAGSAYNGDGNVVLVKDGEAEFAGWNLVGNPFAQTAYLDRDFYVMNAAGTEVEAADRNSVAAMEGVFVIAKEDGEVMSFSTEAPANNDKTLVINVLCNRGTAVDRAMVRLGKESLLPKFMINPDNTKVYIPQNGEDYAVVSANSGVGEIPVNFKAKEIGIYTISVGIRNVEMEYLHLIDNLTGADVDLLTAPGYSFEASSTDYEGRFRLVFKTMTGVGEQTSDGNGFAFVSNGEIIVPGADGNDALQVIDMTGRVVAIQRDAPWSVSTAGMAPGVYVLRLFNSNGMRTQKIVLE